MKQSAIIVSATGPWTGLYHAHFTLLNLLHVKCVINWHQYKGYTQFLAKCLLHPTDSQYKCCKLMNVVVVIHNAVYRILYCTKTIYLMVILSLVPFIHPSIQKLQLYSLTIYDSLQWYTWKIISINHLYYVYFNIIFHPGLLWWSLCLFSIYCSSMYTRRWQDEHDENEMCAI